MFAVRTLLSHRIGQTLRTSTAQRCYCNAAKKPTPDEQKSNRRATYKSVRREADPPHQNHQSSSSKQHDEEKHTGADEQKNTQSESQSSDDGTIQSNLMIRGRFEQVAEKNRETFLSMIKIFETRTNQRRDHVEFIYAALKSMREFGVHRDLAVYKALIDVMPKGKMVPTNVFQTMFLHYPKHQHCIIDLLLQMEENAVMPDYEIEDMLLNTFGKFGKPTVRFWRMMYWMPKYKHLSPWLLPNPIPEDAYELAKLAVAQMCTVDVQSTVKTFDTKTVESAIDKTWIVSGQSPEQQRLLAEHAKGKSITIEGPFRIWLRDRTINYFTLIGDAVPDHLFEDNGDEDDVSDLQMPAFLNPFGKKANPKNKVALKRSIHQQDDGTIFAICATGTSTKDSLLSWVRLLEENGNPNLANTPVLFKFTTAVNDKALVVVVDDQSAKGGKST